MFDEYQMFRDCLRQIAVRDPCSRFAAAAERVLEHRSRETLSDLLELSDGSLYRPRLMSTYGAWVVAVEA